ncbi:MAG: hypothetical protein WHU54_04885 [Candidatus Bathyarchaeia archaeon]
MSSLLCSKALKASTVERKVRALKSLLKRGVELNPEAVVSFLNVVVGVVELRIWCLILSRIICE